MPYFRLCDQDLPGDGYFIVLPCPLLAGCRARDASGTWWLMAVGLVGWVALIWFGLVWWVFLFNASLEPNFELRRGAALRKPLLLNTLLLVW